MAARKFWLVWGGVFTNGTWQEIEPGTEQCVGPFQEAEAAKCVRRDEMRRKVGTAQHRLFVPDLPRPGGESAA